MLIVEKFLKVHIKNQIDNGADVIQIFDSWAGLLEEKDLPNYIYSPTLSEIKESKEILSQMKLAEKKGKGAIAFKGKLLDIVSIKQAKNILDMAKKISEKD